MNRLHICRNAY